MNQNQDLASNVHAPLTIQHPDQHEPTVEELMLDVAESIRLKDAQIKEQREQLLAVKTLLQGIVNEHKRTDAHVATVNRATDEGSTQADGETQC